MSNALFVSVSKALLKVSGLKIKLNAEATTLKGKLEAN
jgi:hypothetical protein